MRSATGPHRRERHSLASLLLALAVPGALGAGDAPVAAERPRCRLELPAISDGSLRVLVTQVDLEGHLRRDAGLSLDLAPDPGKAALPTARRPLLPKEKTLRFVLLIEGSAAYAPATDAVRGAARSFLRALPQDSTGEVWRFGNQVDAPRGFLPISHLLGAVDRYSATDEGELQMVKAVRQGLTVLGGAGDPDTRRVLVLLSDGYNPVMDRRLFRAVGLELARRGVPLFSVAYSPRDVRGPLRNLGELSRHSAGTLRWARSMNDLEPQLVALAEELLAAEVVTFDARAVERFGGAEARLRVKCGEGFSNTCFLAVPARRRVALWIAGAMAAGAAAAAAVWWGMHRRRKAAPRTAAPPAAGLTGRSGSVRGQKVRLGARLTLGIGLSGPETLALGAGPAAPLCELRRSDSASYTVASLGNNVRVFLNGRQLSGSVHLKDGDCIQVGELAELQFHDRIDI